VVLVTPVVAKEIREQHYDNKATKELIVAAHDMGVTLEPMHPNVDDENLALYFSVSAENGEAAQRIAERLRSLKAVEAAYLKPPETIPLGKRSRSCQTEAVREAKEPDPNWS